MRQIYRYKYKFDLNLNIHNILYKSRLRVKKKSTAMSELKDPLNNRVVKNCPLPFQQSLTQKQLFTDTGVNWSQLRQFLKREGKLTKPVLLQLIKKGQQIFRFIQ